MFLSYRLGLVPVDAFDSVPVVLPHHLRQIVNASLGLAKDEHFAAADRTQVLNQTASD